MSSRYPMSPNPRGWYAVAFSTDVAPAATRTVHYFGRDMLLFRGADGALGAFEPYCAHLGAHLGDGEVCDGVLVCPFHGWRWSAEGRCVEVPYAAKVPPRARLTKIPVREQNGMVLLWNDPSGGEPDFEVPVLDDAEWSSSRTLFWSIRTHVQEIMENTVDWSHFGPVHKMRDPRPLSEPVADGPRLTASVGFVTLGEPIGMPGIDNAVEVTFNLHGLGVLLIDNLVPEHGLVARERLYATPVDDERVDVRVSVEMRRLPDEATTEELAEMFYRAFEQDIPRDFRIWERKAYLEKPTLAAGERGFSLFRRWARQFYPKVVAESPEPAPIREDAPVAETPERSPVEVGVSTPVEPGVMTRLRTEVFGLRDRVVGAVRDTVERIPLIRRPPPESPSPESPYAESPAARSPDSPSTRSPQSPRSESPPAGPPESPPPPAEVRTPADYFSTLPSRFVPSAAVGLDAVFQWELSGEGGGTWHAVVRDGTLDVQAGPHEHPGVTLALSAGDYVEMVNGRLNGMVAFTSGRARMAGDMKLAMRMKDLFPVG